MPRKQFYLPLNVCDCPVDPRHFKDTRTTNMTTKNDDGSTSETQIRDSWRCLSDASDLRQDKEWTGYTEFQISSRFKDFCDHDFTISMFSLAVIPKELKTGKVSVDVFDYAKIRNDPCKTGKMMRLKLDFGGPRMGEGNLDLLLCEEDQADDDIGNISITLYSANEKKPRLVLVCSEESNWFTKLEKVVGQYMTIVTITADDDLLSLYGVNKARACLRDESDAMFFAGPCTGGSSWARLNKTRSTETALLIRRRQVTFWKLFDVFARLMEDRKRIPYRSLLELPRHCDYWKDPHMIKLIDESDNHINDFDGCCYGLREQFSHPPRYIKKPWRVVSWGVDFGDSLSKRCDGRHEHAPCAGRETIGTQIYTSNIVSIILRRPNEDLDQDRVILSEDESRRSPLRVRTRGTKSKAACAVVLLNFPTQNFPLELHSCSNRHSDCDFELHLSVGPSNLCLYSSAIPCDPWSSERFGNKPSGSSELDNKMAATTADTPNVNPIVQGSGGGTVDLFMSRVDGASLARNSCAVITITYDQGNQSWPKFRMDVDMDISHAYTWHTTVNLPIFVVISFWFMTGPVNDERIRVWLFNFHRYACDDDCKRNLSTYMGRVKLSTKAMKV